ncbi:hypothetical protein [Halobaculum gomorrense]|uniref:Uncharacterized protein n=1 Tax=Halobaculum gomorrense TaxID=43928 RepID=A0A1M5UU73_9EURY|nr:hypothetical protein [Halobaculum gomorrense]SHH66283.1 hypothetical protein SAMN05443636_3133 [Halobaculum gomorrense]
MKAGSSNDPFSDDDQDEQHEDEPTEAIDDDVAEVAEPVSESPETQDDVVDERDTSSGSRLDQYPYKLRRDSVKDERDMVQLYVQDSTERRSAARKAEFEEEHEVDIYLTDWREAAFLAGVEDREIVGVLREWGYDI